MRLEIVIDDVFPRSVETVWRALTEPGALSEWLMEASEFGPEVGARFTLQSEAHDCTRGLVEIEVLEMDPPRRLVWSWATDAGAPPTIVTFELHPDPAGTRLRLTHFGDMDPDTVRGTERGWPEKLGNLMRVLNSVPDNEEKPCRRHD